MEGSTKTYIFKTFIKISKDFEFLFEGHFDWSRSSRPLHRLDQSGAWMATGICQQERNYKKKFFRLYTLTKK